MEPGATGRPEGIAAPRINPAVTPFEETAAYQRYNCEADPGRNVGEELYTKAIIQEQGFDGLPQVVSQAELDQYVARGEVELCRGVAGAQFADQFRYGEMYVGRGAFGGGVYAAVADASELGKEVARAYTEGAPGGLLRMTLKQGAKVVYFELPRREKDTLRERELATLERQRTTIGQKEYTRRQAAVEALFYDVGRFAAYHGYDAIYIEEEAYYLILNRTAVRVQREEIT